MASIKQILVGGTTYDIKATYDGSGNTIASYYCTLSTNQTITGTKTFTARPVIDISGTALTADAAANILSFKYQNPQGHSKTVNVIRTYGDSESSTNNGIAIIGSSSGTTVISAGENAPTVIANQAISNNENAYIITDGSINFWTASTASAPKKAVTIDTTGRTTFLNYNGTGFYARNISYGTDTPSGGSYGDVYIQYTA